jgi:hypothetical protein
MRMPTALLTAAAAVTSAGLVLAAGSRGPYVPYRKVHGQSDQSMKRSVKQAAAGAPRGVAPR